MTDQADRLAEAARAAIRVMARWGLDFEPEYAALLHEVVEHDQQVIADAVALARAGEAA